MEKRSAFPDRNTQQIVRLQLRDFSEQLFRFEQLLREHDTVVVGGYGFSDEGITQRLWNWLLTEPFPRSRRAIFMHEAGEQLISDRLQAWQRMSAAYYKLEEEKRIRFVKSWMKDVSLNQLKVELA